MVDAAATVYGGRRVAPDYRGYIFSEKPVDWLPAELRPEALSAFLRKEFERGAEQNHCVYDGGKRLYVKEDSSTAGRILEQSWDLGSTVLVRLRPITVLIRNAISNTTNGMQLIDPDVLVNPEKARDAGAEAVLEAQRFVQVLGST